MRMTVLFVRIISNSFQGQILISEACYEKIKESFACKKVGEKILKNKKEPVMVYEVLS